MPRLCSSLRGTLFLAKGLDITSVPILSCFDNVKYKHHNKPFHCTYVITFFYIKKGFDRFGSAHHHGSGHVFVITGCLQMYLQIILQHNSHMNHENQNTQFSERK